MLRLRLNWCIWNPNLANVGTNYVFLIDVTFYGDSMLTQRDLHVKLTITNKHMVVVTLGVHTYTVCDIHRLFPT